MRQDTTAPGGGAGGGGGKKFLYSGPRQRGSFFEDTEVSPMRFPSEDIKPKAMGDGIDSGWTIQKNISTKAPTNTINASEGWYFNIGKGYYSRHGGLNENQSKDADEAAAKSEGNWGQRKTFSYGQPTSDKPPASQTYPTRPTGGGGGGGVTPSSRHF